MVPWLKPTRVRAEGGNATARELGIEKAIENGRRLVDADPALIGIPEGEGEPLPSDRRLPARLRSVRRDKGTVRQERLPGAADLD